MADWSALDKPIILLLMKKLRNSSDKIRFSGVCSSWRSVALQDRLHLLSFAPPGFIIPGPPNNNSRKTNCFLPLTKINQCKDNATHVQRSSPLLFLPDKIKFRGSYQGWLVMVTSKLDMAMLNLVSGVRFRLPGVMTLPPIPEALAISKPHVYYSMSSVNKAILSSIPTYTHSSQCFVFVIYTRHHALAYCKLGDKIWSPIKSKDSEGKHCNGFTDAIYHKGQLYALHKSGKIFTCDLTIHSEMTVFFAGPCSYLTNQYSMEKCYLVESGGDLLVIYRGKENTHSRIGYRTRMFKIFKLDFSLKKWIQVASLGEYALFLGLGQSFSISELKVGGIKRNHIYFMDDSIHADYYYTKKTGYDMGEFHLESSTIDFYPTSFRLPYLPGFWVNPTLQSSLG